MIILSVDLIISFKIKSIFKLKQASTFMRPLFFLLSIFIFSLIGCTDDRCQEIHEEINSCKLKSIKSSSDMNDFNDRIESISVQINNLDKKTYSTDDILELKREAEELNKIRSKEMIKFISLEIDNIKNGKDQLNTLATLSSNISMKYSILILDDDRIQLNFLNEEITNIKASAEMELKWTEWKNNLRNALKGKINEEWKMYLKNKYNYKNINNVDYDIFEIDLKTNSITDSPKEKFITINFTGKLNSKVNEGVWIHDQHEIKSQFNGTYNSKYTIGNDPYLEKVNINFQDQYVRKIN